MFTVRQGKSTDRAFSFFFFGSVPPSSTSKHKHLLFSLPTGPPGNLILLIHSHIYSGGGVLLAPLKVCAVVFRWPVFVCRGDSLCTLIYIL